MCWWGQPTSICGKWLFLGDWIHWRRSDSDNVHLRPTMGWAVICGWWGYLFPGNRHSLVPQILEQFYHWLYRAKDMWLDGWRFSIVFVWDLCKVVLTDMHSKIGHTHYLFLVNTEFCLACVTANIIEKSDLYYKCALLLGKYITT